MESANDKARLKRSVALMNFLQNHPRHLNSVSRLDREGNEKQLYARNQTSNKSRTDDLFGDLSHVRIRAMSILMIKHGLNFEQMMVTFPHKTEP